MVGSCSSEGRGETRETIAGPIKNLVGPIARLGQLAATVPACTYLPYSATTALVNFGGGISKGNKKILELANKKKRFRSTYSTQNS